jgi:hypothetical protein
VQTPKFKLKTGFTPEGELMSIDRERATKRTKSLVLAAQKIRPADLAREAGLLTLKWPDYRFMAPLDATMLFGRLYQKQFQMTIARDVDRRLAKNVRGIDMTRIMSEPGRLTSLWTARQHADELGIRYPEYLEFCFEFATNVRRKKLPQPNQLYFSEASEPAWLARLMEFWPERLFSGLANVDDLPQFRLEFFRGLPAQVGYRQFIIDRAKEGNARWRDVMRRHSVERRQLPIRQIIRAIGRERFREELRSLRDDGRAFPFSYPPPVQITEDHLWQSCFGVPHAFSPGNEPCVSCPQAAGCRRLADYVLATVKRITGTTDPVRQREREQGRDRTRRCREKKKREREQLAPGA